MKLLIILFLCVLLIILFLNANIYHIEAQKFYKTNNSLAEYYKDTENSAIGIKIKYPENWTLDYTMGNNNSLAMSNESFKFFIEDYEKFYKSIFYYYFPTDHDKYQFFQEIINTNCGFIADCRLIEDKYLRSYIIDQQNFIPFVSIFDYLPSLTLFSPTENLNDRFLENINIASFKMPQNLTLGQFIVSNYENYLRIPSFEIIEDNCQFTFSGYHGCSITYTFTVGNNIEMMQYITSDFLIEKNKKIYLISYTSLTETYPKYIEMVKKMLESLVLL